MSILQYFDNMYDARLKPRLLHSLIDLHLPDEKHPFPSLSDLSYIVSSIKTHGLLSELHHKSIDQMQPHEWKSAIDAWFERLLALISSKMPDKCWAGVCLLGVTCQECSSDRFLASYSVWFHKLLLLIQPPADSHFVKVASCAALSDLFTRLGGFTNTKKDGTSLAGKLIQPVLQLIGDSSEAVSEGAVDLLNTLINFFPSSVPRHYDSVEAAIVSKIMAGKFSATMSKKLAQCLAFLPRGRGDEDSWSLMMQKIILSINVHLNDAFQGLEEETKGAESVSLLLLPGKEPPPPLGGQLVSADASEQATKKFKQLLMPRVSTLMQCCSMMLTSPYPVQVTVPVRPLLALVGRILSVDGSLCQALLPFTIVTEQEFICSELPTLHLYSLDLLIAIIKGVHSQILPHAANIVRLLTEYFRRCVLPAARIKVYSIMRTLLISMGVGMALYLTQEVINNAFADLNFNTDGCGFTPSKPCSLQGGTGVSKPPPGHKKRKHVSASEVEYQSGVDLESEMCNKKPVVPISVQIAALQALEALVTVGGALKSECWRANVDLLLITVATNACDGSWSYEERNFHLSEQPTSSWTDFQLAALQALLASLLSPSVVRPPYLSQGLALFREGKQESRTKIAQFCAHALLALEVLIHPRSLPLVDFPVIDTGTLGGGSSRGSLGNIYSGGQKPSTSISRNEGQSPRQLGVDDVDPFDYIYESWLGNGEEVGAHVSNPDTQVKMPDESSKPVADFPTSEREKEEVYGEGSRSTDQNPVEETSNVDVVTRDGRSGDENCKRLQQLTMTVSSEMRSKDANSSELASLAAPDSGEVAVSASMEPVTSKGKEIVSSPDSDSDSLPEIVLKDLDSVSGSDSE